MGVWEGGGAEAGAGAGAGNKFEHVQGGPYLS